MPAPLLSILRRSGGNDLVPNVVHLSMSRMDIGNFLGLTMETVSRFLSILRREGVIAVDGRAITIHNHQRLNELGKGC